jgi:hypothetical protein
MNDELRHTPGPWRIHLGNCGTLMGLMSERGAVAMLGRATAINPADAVLLAAAPDLLAAARAALDHLERTHQPTIFDAFRNSARIIGQLRAAIAKATGKEDRS